MPKQFLYTYFSHLPIYANNCVIYLQMYTKNFSTVTHIKNPIYLKCVPIYVYMCIYVTFG